MLAPSQSSHRACATSAAAMKNRVLLLVFLLALLLLLEVGLRLTVAPQVDVPHLRVSPHGFYTWYPGSRFAYHNLPSVEPATADVRINEHGLRGESFPRAKPAGERRVLVLGDSYTAAVQLPEDVIFTTRLERTLNESAPPGSRTRVLNAGFNGFGTAHELLYFLYEGRDLAPDVVVLQYSFNDAGDTRDHGGVRWSDGRLDVAEALLHPPPWRGPLLAMRDAVGNRSLTFFLLYKSLGDLATRAGVRPAHAAPPDPAPAAPDTALVQHVVEHLIATANTSGAPVIVLMIPSPLYITGGDAAYDQVAAAARAMTAGTGNQLIVADPLLLAVERAGRPVYLAHDGHLSAEGHGVITAALAPAVLRSMQPSQP